MGGLPKEGDKLGRFAIKRKIGQGGMGIVYLAHDPLLNIDVAIKLLEPAFIKSGRIERFQREVLVARRIAHAGVCRLYDIHQEDDQLFVTMEYVPGPTLKSLIQDKGRLPVARAVDLGRPICQALAAAHKDGVIHRDLKPNNIVVRGTDKVSVLDFGLAKALDMASITATGIQVGTYHYMSPEVIRGEPASAQSDIYSFGVILYECLTGNLPFQGPDIMALGRAIQTGSPLPVSRLNPAVPEELEDLVEKCMARDPAGRFTGMNAVDEALASIREGLPEPAAEVPEDADAAEDLKTRGRDRPQVRTDSGGIHPAALPWDGDIEKSVEMAVADPNYSQMIRTRMRDSTILFSDIVGITPFFEKYGDVAGLKRIKVHNDLLFPVIERHRGKVVKTIGDAIMASFNTADEGVGAAIGMQRTLARHNASVAEEKDKLYIRIGLNSGKSIFEHRDVFGDTVNVAARISALAEGNQILISSDTRQLLGPGLDLTRFHKEVALKGKSDAVGLYSVHWSLDQEIRTELHDVSAESAIYEVEAPVRPAAPRRINRALLAVAAGGLAGVLAFVAVLLVTNSGPATDDAAVDTPAAETQPRPGPATRPLAATPAVSETEPPPEPSPAEPARPESDEPETTPEPTGEVPAPDPPEVAARTAGTDDRARREFRELRKVFYTATARKGIIRGDHRELDRMKKRMNVLARQGKHAEASALARNASRILDRISVNEAFIKSKLNRFNDLYDRKKTRRLEKQVEPAILAFWAARDSGDLNRANEALNRAFQILRSKRR